MRTKIESLIEARENNRGAIALLDKQLQEIDDSLAALAERLFAGLEFVAPALLHVGGKLHKFERYNGRWMYAGQWNYVTPEDNGE